MHPRSSRSIGHLDRCIAPQTLKILASSGNLYTRASFLRQPKVSKHRRKVSDQSKSCTNHCQCTRWTHIEGICFAPGSCLVDKSDTSLPPYRSHNPGHMASKASLLHRDRNYPCTYTAPLVGLVARAGCRAGINQAQYHIPDSEGHTICTCLRLQTHH